MTNLLDKDKKNIWHPFTSLAEAEEPILISSAKGIYLHTPDGRKIIDAVSSWWTNIHGHAHPTLANALTSQANILEHVIFAGFTHEPAIKLSENLLSILPLNQNKIFFSDNGSTAVEVAIKMALQYWYNRGITKNKIIAIRGAYHGDTFGAMSAGDRGIFTEPFAAHLFDVEFIDFPDDRNKQNAVTQFKRFIKEKNIAAFIFEPLIQAAGGMRMYSASTLDQFIELARAQDIICIADEVFTGFGRTGKLFASDYLTNKPDIIALSKGITGGTMPLGVTSCSKKITEAFETDNTLRIFFHRHSYTANPLACAVANASFELLIHKSCSENIDRISEKHQTFKLEIEGHPALYEVRVLGTILALELRSDSETSYTNSIRKKIYAFFLLHNILLRPLGNIFYVLPPYIITDSELDTIYIKIKEFLNSLIAA